MIEISLLASIRARLTAALAPPIRPYRPLLVDSAVVGWIDDARARHLRAFAEVFEVTTDAVRFSAALDTPAARTEALAPVAEALAAESLLSAWRNERYTVAEHYGAPPLLFIERAAARYFGIHSYAAHINGLVRDDSGPGCSEQACAIWIAQRSPNKAIDPGLLDNLVGGGIAASISVAATVEKEAWEEAGIDAPLARRALPVGVVHICRDQPDGLHRETIFVHDLWLPASFVPASVDGEALAQRRVTLAEAARLIALAEGPMQVTADASLVILDCLLRLGVIPADAPDYLALAALRHPMLMPRCHSEGD